MIEGSFWLINQRWYLSLFLRNIVVWIVHIPCRKIKRLTVCNAATWILRVQFIFWRIQSSVRSYIICQLKWYLIIKHAALTQFQSILVVSSRSHTYLLIWNELSIRVGNVCTCHVCAAWCQVSPVDIFHWHWMQILPLLNHVSDVHAIHTVLRFAHIYTIGDALVIDTIEHLYWCL